MIPDGRVRGDLDAALAGAVPVRDGHRRPAGRCCCCDRRQGREPLPFHPRSSVLAWSSRWCGLIQSGIEAQAGDDGDRLTPAPAGGEEVQRGVAAVGYRDDHAVRPPAAHDAEQLAGPVGHRLVLTAALGVVAFGGRERGEDGQRPGAGCPGDGDQQHQADPAQPACFHEMAVAGANGVAVDALGRDPLAAAERRRRSLVSSMPKDERAIGNEGRDQHAQQHAAGREIRTSGRG